MTDKKYILLTGATGAIGGEIAKALLHRGESLIMTCRNPKKGDALMAELKSECPDADIRMLIMNLADENSVREAVKSLDGITLKAIANNAGIMNRHFQQIADGTELTIAVNYKNTRLLNELLIDSVAEGGVIAFTSSLTRFMYHKGETVDNLSADQFHQLRTYGLSKRMLTDYARELSVRLAPKGVRVNCADPGIVDSSMITMSRWYDPLANIFFRPFIRSPRHGAIPMLRALQSHLTAKIFCRYRIHSI